MKKPLLRLALAWVGLLLLLALTLAMAYVPLGRGNIAVALAIAAAKGVIVLLVFMKLLHSPPLTWIFAGAGLFWLVILFGLTFTDYATRTGFPPQP
jgi:cytochrome c oxidase subunit 4